MTTRGAGASPSSGSTPPADRRGARFTTRRRLTAVFAIVLAAFVASLALQLAVLRRMEVTFDAMEEHEYQETLALGLQDALRAQYGQAGAFVTRRSAGLDEYRRARSRADELVDALRARVDEPESVAWMEEIREASLALDGTFRDRIAPAVLRGDPAAAPTLATSEQLVFAVERNIGRLLARLQLGTGAFRKELQELQTASRRWTVVFFVAVPILVVAAVLYLSRSVARPLARLSEGAAGISREGLDARIEIDTPDEFGALAAEFNAMTAALKRQQEKLVESETLAGIGRLAAGVAHEINNPLQVMLGYLSIHRSIPEPRLRRDLAAVEQEALRCKEIVEGLLELSGPSVSPVPVDLRAVCDDVVRSLRGSAASGAPRVAVDGRAATVGDPAKLRQVVTNLLKNAIEAAGPAGDVRAELRESGSHAELTVSDTGPGIPPEARGRLFEPFFTTKPSGTGLGLAASRAIALAHGGDVTAGSGEGRGAVFTLRLPRAPAG